MQPQKFETQMKTGKSSSDMHSQWLSEEIRLNFKIWNCTELKTVCTMNEMVTNWMGRLQQNGRVLLLLCSWQRINIYRIERIKKTQIPNNLTTKVRGQENEYKLSKIEIQLNVWKDAPHPPASGRCNPIQHWDSTPPQWERRSSRKEIMVNSRVDTRKGHHLFIAAGI